MRYKRITLIIGMIILMIALTMAGLYNELNP